jgi:hypothetical protein
VERRRCVVDKSQVSVHGPRTTSMLKLDCDSTGPGKVNPTRRARQFGPERATVGTVSTTGTHTADERTAYRRAGCVADKSQVTSHRSQVTRRNHRPCPSWIETRLARLARLDSLVGVDIPVGAHRLHHIIERCVASARHGWGGSSTANAYGEWRVASHPRILSLVQSVLSRAPPSEVQHNTELDGSKSDSAKWARSISH